MLASSFGMQEASEGLSVHYDAQRWAEAREGVR